jgi:membrane carboxypeptidase/penicillin-binding protein
VVQPPRTSYVLPLVRSKLLERYGSDVIDRGGLEVTTAFDLTLQIQAERTVTEGVTRLNPRLQGALVSLDAATGDILAVAGGIDGTRSSYNRAVAARRQPGSAIKPFIYAAALEQGMVTAATIRDDAPRAYKSGTGTLWTPHNYGDEQYGPLSLRQALAYSSNTIAVGLLEELGVGPFVDFARTMGLDLPLQNGLSLALGTGEAPPLGLVAAYASLANGGLHPEPRCIIRVYDRTRNLWTENPAVTTPVLSAGTSFIITQMLKDVLTSGTAKSLKGFSQKHPCAGKTGTTDDYRDAWFIGYTPRIVTGVWVGYDQPRSGGRGFTGGVVAAPIWERFMRKAVALFPADDFAQPDTVITVSIDPATGQLATATCPTRRDEFFRAGTEPHELCHLHPDTTAAPPPAVVP